MSAPYTFAVTVVAVAAVVIPLPIFMGQGRMPKEKAGLQLVLVGSWKRMEHIEGKGESNFDVMQIRTGGRML